MRFQTQTLESLRSLYGVYQQYMFAYYREEES